MDVRQVVLVLSATVLVLVLEKIAMTQPIIDHERLDVDRVAMDYVASSYQFARVSSRLDRAARDQWLRGSESIPWNIAHADSVDPAQKTVAADAIEYEYEYRDAEYEYEENRITES